MTTATPTVQFTVKMREFKRKLRATSYAADNNPGVPVLSTIRILVETNQIMMLATNRHIIIATRQDTDPDATTVTGEMLLDGRALKYLAMMTTTDEDRVTVRLGQDTVSFDTGAEAVSVTHTPWEYPASIDSLLAGFLEAQTENQLSAFNPHYLEAAAKSFKLLYPHQPLAIQGAASKKALPSPSIFYGTGADDWVAILQPINVLSDSSGWGKAAKEAFTSILKAQAEKKDNY